MSRYRALLLCTSAPTVLNPLYVISTYIRRGNWICVFYSLFKRNSNKIFSVLKCKCWCRGPRSLGRRSLAARLLGLRVRNPTGACMFVLCVLHNKDKKTKPGKLGQRSNKKNPAGGVDVCVVCSKYRQTAKCRTIKSNKEVGMKCKHSTREYKKKNPSGGMDVRFICFFVLRRERPLRRADHSSRGVLPSVCVSLCLIKRNNNPLHLQWDRQNRFA
jgi:hypothetical protein